MQPLRPSFETLAPQAPQDEVRFQNASSDTIIATDQMTTAQSADQIVAVKKSTGRNERKARVFARQPGWTLANANAFHVAYSGQPNTALMTFTSTIPIKIGPSDPALPTVSNATMLTQSLANGSCCRRATLAHWLWLKLSGPLFRWKTAS